MAGPASNRPLAPRSNRIAATPSSSADVKLGPTVAFVAGMSASGVAVMTSTTDPDMFSTLRRYAVPPALDERRVYQDRTLPRDVHPEFVDAQGYGLCDNADCRCGPRRRVGRIPFRVCGPYLYLVLGSGNQTRDRIGKQSLVGNVSPCAVRRSLVPEVVAANGIAVVGWGSPCGGDRSGRLDRKGWSRRCIGCACGARRWSRQRKDKQVVFR